MASPLNSIKSTYLSRRGALTGLSTAFSKRLLKGAWLGKALLSQP
jgi:hypothetical protein